MSEDQAPYAANEGHYTDRTVLRQYPTIEEFYAAEPAAKLSGERDYGCWWRDELQGTWRVSWVFDTDDVYVMRTNPFSQRRPKWLGAGNSAHPVAVIGSVPKDDIERVLDGWGDACGKANSLYWVFDRIEAYNQSRSFSPSHPIAKAFAQLIADAGKQGIHTFCSLYGNRSEEEIGLLVNAGAFDPKLVPLNMLAAATLLQIRDATWLQRIALLVGVIMENPVLMMRALVGDSPKLEDSFIANAPNADADQLRKLLDELARQQTEVLRQRSRTPDRDTKPDS